VVSASNQVNRSLVNADMGLNTGKKHLIMVYVLKRGHKRIITATAEAHFSDWRKAGKNVFHLRYCRPQVQRILLC
jgi:hypothetical protein